MVQSFGFFDLLTSPVFMNVALVLFVLSLFMLILQRKKLSATVKAFWIVLLVICALYLLFVAWAGAMWGQPPHPPVPAPPLG